VSRLLGHNQITHWPKSESNHYCWQTNLYAQSISDAAP